MKILVTCELPQAALDELATLGSEVQYQPQSGADDLPSLVPEAGVLIVDSTRVTRDTILRGSVLQMIVRAGPGPGNIAIDDASSQGVFVTHCPLKDATAIAELTLGLILALDRQIVEHTTALRQGRWSRVEHPVAHGLAGRALGVLGFGRVGQEVARRARAFDMKVAAWSPTLTPERAAELGVDFCNWPRELARRSDIVSVHAGPDASQQHVVDDEFLESLPIGAYLVHVGHPAALDESALAEAIVRRKLRAALDVHATEPVGDNAKFRSRLLQLPGVIGTPHIGGETAQAREAIATEVLRVVRAFLVHGEVLNCVNLAERSPARWQLLLRVRDQVGVMASILDAVRADGINAEEISSRVFTGAKAAWCTIALDERPSGEALDAIRSLKDVLHLELRAVV